jgi:RNA polymerase sigma-70 factor (ECF subfamily)
MEIQIFKQQVLPIREKIYRLALKMLHDEAEAEDSVQEVMLKLWMMRATLAEYRSVEALATQIGKNICLNRIKTRKMSSDKPFEQMQSSLPTPEQALETADTIETVSRIIDRLPDMQRLVIRLRDIEGYQVEEIAGITGCEATAVRMNLSRARKKVKEEFFKINQIHIS